MSKTICVILLISSDQWQTQDLPDGGDGAPTYYFGQTVSLSPPGSPNADGKRYDYSCSQMPRGILDSYLRSQRKTSRHSL